MELCEEFAKTSAGVKEISDEISYKLGYPPPNYNGTCESRAKDREKDGGVCVTPSAINKKK